MTKKKILLMAIILGAVVIGPMWWSAAQAGKTDASAELKLEAVDVGPVRLIVTAAGKVAANNEVDIKCKASGEVINLPFDVADVVKKGTLVLELDPVDEQRRVDQQKAALIAAECRLAKAQQVLRISEQTLSTDTRHAEIAVHMAQITATDMRSKAEHLEKLLEKSLANGEEYDSAMAAAKRAEASVDEAKNALQALKTRPISIEMDRTEVKLAETAVETAKNDLLDAEQRLKETKVMAPIDGVVTTRPAQIGTIVSSGITNVGGGTSILTLADLSRLFVLAPVDEADIGRVKKEQHVIIKCDAFPESKFTGKILRIAVAGHPQNGVVTFEVKIEVLGDGKELLKPEMSTDIEIVIAEKDKVLRVPSEAVRTRAKDKKRYVLVPAAGSASQPANAATANKAVTIEREVEIGVDDGQWCEILSGLKEGEKVAMGDAFTGEWEKLKVTQE